MLIFALILTCLMLTVIITDGLRYIIPNWLVVAMLALYPAMVVALHVPGWPLAVAISLACFAVGFLIFILNIMGGGRCEAADRIFGLCRENVHPAVYHDGGSSGRCAGTTAHCRPAVGGLRCR